MQIIAMLCLCGEFHGLNALKYSCRNCCHPYLYSLHVTVSEDILSCNFVVAYNVCKCLCR